MTGVKIDVRIPFEPGGKLGADYNRILGETPHPWVLLLDHDVLLMCPHWYYVCQRAIAEHPQTGIFTCYTNAIGNPEQRAPEAPGIEAAFPEHRRYARTLFDHSGTSSTLIDGAKCSGMFLLIRKQAWAKVGGFPGLGMFREDWTFGRKIQSAGIAVRRLDGLYVFHLRDRSEGSWIPGVDTSKEIRDRLYREGKIRNRKERHK